MTNTNYNCASLDNLARSNVLAVQVVTDADGGRLPRLYTSQDFAAYSAGVVFRAAVHDTVEFSTSYDYAIGATVVDFVDYGNGTTEENTITNAPAYAKAGRFDVAQIVNYQISAYRFGEPSIFGNREFDVLINCVSVTWSKDESCDCYTFNGSGCFVLAIDANGNAKIAG